MRPDHSSLKPGDRPVTCHSGLLRGQDTCRYDPVYYDPVEYPLIAFELLLLVPRAPLEVGVRLVIGPNTGSETKGNSNSQALQTHQVASMDWATMK